MDGVTFIRKNGRVIPIRASSGAARATSAISKHPAARAAVTAAHGASVIHRISKIKKPGAGSSVVKVHKGLDALGLGLSVGTGALAAATFSGGGKMFLSGALAAHAIDAIGVGINAASVAGRGHTKERVKQGARQEARNLIIGNAVYAAGILGVRKNRKTLVSAAQKVLSLGKKFLARGL